MKIKYLTGVLTVFENFLTQLNKNFSSKKKTEIIWEWFLPLIKLPLLVNAENQKIKKLNFLLEMYKL